MERDISFLNYKPIDKPAPKSYLSNIASKRKLSSALLKSQDLSF
jgi:hypothetical protein